MEMQAAIAAKAERADRTARALHATGSRLQWSPEVEREYAHIMYRGVAMSHAE